jgi:hypothetical protein
MFMIMGIAFLSASVSCNLFQKNQFGNAVALAEAGQINNAVVVHPANGQPYLRSRPDNKKSNNFAEMAKA